MAYVKRHRVNINYTVADQASQAFYTEMLPMGGFIEGIIYNRAAASAVATGAKYVITCGQSSQPILTIGTASADYMGFYPNHALQDTSGGAVYGATEASAGQRILGRIPVGQEAIKIEVTSGGASACASGAKAHFDFYIGGV